MNEFDDVIIDKSGFAYRDLKGIDMWLAFVVAAVLTVVGTPTYVGRFRVVGKSCFFQISAVSSTSIASTAGTSYFSLPIPAKGIGGVATMSNDTSNIAVGTCHIDVATSRCYTPAQSASGNAFTICGYYEIA